MASKASCCPTCGRRYVVKRPAPAGTPVDLAALSTSQLYAYYKRTALVEDVRFALRIGADLPADLAIGWTALLADVEAGRVKGTEAYRQLAILQDAWGRLRNATELEERRIIAPFRRWAWMIKIPGAWKHYPMRAACAEFELPKAAVPRALAS